MTVEHLSRHLKRDVGANDLEVLLSGEIEAGRPMLPTSTLFGRVGRLRMRGMWKEAGYSGRHRRRGRL
ncbi:hypothetical protein K3N28_21205 [Glycomyces sp. TRM65418]|uniref:hypothetical protein n=1 Tax=Glycomyces sp. TRM65418 TaxID=2867006 RepID=UPI001CE5FB35|nr:hypothetical protein [Glycomyces sp. TRM65418]MCC3765583.1 hypothetical protein [Glycomyces sp. TRM65418]QZD55183.1 hypothetical protein K3N28_21095 [Glycomyces sp. TRM65418]